MVEYGSRVVEKGEEKATGGTTIPSTTNQSVVVDGSRSDFWAVPNAVGTTEVCTQIVWYGGMV
jgi:hypothetical protein